MVDLIDEPFYQGDNSDPYDVDEFFSERSAGLTLLAKIAAYELLPEHSETLLDNINKRIDVDEFFSERSAGLTLLAKIAAYELLPEHSETLLDNINKRIDVLYEMQHSNPDNNGFDGTFRHSWARHEGSEYNGNEPNDRRFSPWMSENLVDALWQYYQIESSEKVRTMLEGIAKGTLNWGFSGSKGYIDKFGSSLSNLPNGANWGNGCSNTLQDKPKPILLYSGSSIADSASLISTQNSEGWYSDSHHPQAILTLAIGYHFSTDPAEKEEFQALIQDIHDSYFTTLCGQGSSTIRKFNWNNRSNSWGTYLYFKNN